MESEEGLLSVEEGISRLGVSRATFWNLVKRHNVPRYTIPVQVKRVFFKPADLDALRQPRRVVQDEDAVTI